jgi:hypothetical protein
MTRGMHGRSPMKLAQLLFFFFLMNCIEACSQLGDHGGGSLQGLEPRVAREMNQNLHQAFTPAEVDLALKQMHSLKSPRPDGKSAYFYQHSWATVKGEVSMAVLDFLNNEIFDSSINDTFISLIPKIKNPTRITEYRPISLCNVIYKLIAKVLANCLKKVLMLIISPN